MAFIHYETQLIYIFTYKTVLSCPTLIGSHQITLCLIWPFPHSFLILLLLLFSLHQGQHDSTVSLCLGRSLSHTSCAPARRLLQQLLGEIYKEVAKVCREEVQKAKAQLELRLATAVKENKKSFYEYISGKRRTKENFHPLLDAAGDVTTEDKKTEILNASCPNISVHCSF